MYDSFWRQFKHSEKVQLVCMLRDSHGPQISVSLTATQLKLMLLRFCSQSNHWEVSCSQAEIISPFLLPVCWLTADMDWASSEQYRGLDMRMVQFYLNCSQYCLYPREAGKWCKIHPSIPWQQIWSSSLAASGSFQSPDPSGMDSPKAVSLLKPKSSAAGLQSELHLPVTFPAVISLPHLNSMLKQKNEKSLMFKSLEALVLDKPLKAGCYNYSDLRWFK